MNHPTIYLGHKQPEGGLPALKKGAVVAKRSAYANGKRVEQTGRVAGDWSLTQVIHKNGDTVADDSYWTFPIEWSPAVKDDPAALYKARKIAQRAAMAAGKRAKRTPPGQAKRANA